MKNSFHAVDRTVVSSELFGHVLAFFADTNSSLPANGHWRRSLLHIIWFSYCSRWPPGEQGHDFDPPAPTSHFNDFSAHTHAPHVLYRGLQEKYCPTVEAKRLNTGLQSMIDRLHKGEIAARFAWGCPLGTLACPLMCHCFVSRRVPPLFADLAKFPTPFPFYPFLLSCSLTSVATGVSHFSPVCAGAQESGVAGAL